MANNEQSVIPEEFKGKKFRIRKLTPRECFRLMDVDEDKIDRLMAYDEDGKQIISNSQLYKCAGNSIVVSCMEFMFENMLFPDEVKETKPKAGTQLSLW